MTITVVQVRVPSRVPLKRVVLKFRAALFLSCRNDNPIQTHPERVFFNPYQNEELWVTSFGNGMRVGTNTSAARDVTEGKQLSARIVENPASDAAMRVELTLPQSESVVCRLYNARGELVKDFAPVIVPQGVSQQQLALPGVAKGVYFLQTTSARAHIVRQVMVL